MSARKNAFGDNDSLTRKLAVDLQFLTDPEHNANDKGVFWLVGKKEKGLYRMKVAIFSDIHSNFLALAEVIQHAQDRSVNRFWCLVTW
jgi:hypothetical protein